MDNHYSKSSAAWMRMPSLQEPTGMVLRHILNEGYPFLPTHWSTCKFFSFWKKTITMANTHKHTSYREFHQFSHEFMQQSINRQYKSKIIMQ